MRKIMIGLMFLACVSWVFAGAGWVNGGYLKQSTAKVITVGPFLDDDGSELAIALTAADAEMTLIKAGTASAAGALTQVADMTAATNLYTPTALDGDSHGGVDCYGSVQLTTGNTNTLGDLTITISSLTANVCFPVTYVFQVVTADYYNMMFTTSTIATAAEIATAISVAADWLLVLRQYIQQYSPR